MTDIFTVLEHEHQEVQAILDDLEKTAVVTPTEDRREVVDGRGRLVERLVIEESKHEAAEEEYFWPAVREHAEDGDRLAQTAIAQESEGKHVLDKLRKQKPGTEAFDALVEEFVSAGREHIAYEEGVVWPALRSALTAQQSAELGAAFSAARQLAPTRPHPHTPANPGLLKTAGMAAAMVDRARDALSRRGK